MVESGHVTTIVASDWSRAMVGTPEFVSPEVVSFEDIHTNTDMVTVQTLDLCLSYP